MLAFTDGTCVYIMLLPLGFIFAECIAKRIHVFVPSPRGCVRVRISTIPALIVEGDYQGHPLESRGIKI